MVRRELVLGSSSPNDNLLLHIDPFKWGRTIYIVLPHFFDF